MKLVGFVGFKGSGKNSAAIPLLAAGYVHISCADAIKDALSFIFCWPRDLLEGDTDESRVWREQIDDWWQERLGIADFSPRKALQLVGTEALRQHFHPDIWLLNVERRLSLMPDDSKIVITDLRFPNEINMVRQRQGSVQRIKRGTDPDWYNLAKLANSGNSEALASLRVRGVHESEFAWIGAEIDGVLENDTSLDDLFASVSDRLL